ncbi:MAG: diacylglycerol kinase family protein [Flavobacteriales bacterium]
MLTPIKILFIINPISGTVKKSGVQQLIKTHLDLTKFNYTIIHTEYPLHATEIAKREAENYPIIVAVGGDGTVHEVGIGLIHTNTILGIIPMGSGNGLARHLKIPMSTKKAILNLNHYKSKAIDTVKINDTFFIGAGGIGFDAHISNLFAKAKKRGFITYLKISIKEFFNYKEAEYELTIDDKIITTKAFLITFANSNQYGNNAFIAPESIINDGLISIVILKKFSLFYALPLAIKLFTKKINSSKFVEEIKIKKAHIKSPHQEIHLDGEPLLTDREIDIEVLPLSLNVITNE